jgi:hypothetical protein
MSVRRIFRPPRTNGIPIEKSPAVRAVGLDRPVEDKLTTHDYPLTVATFEPIKVSPAEDVGSAPALALERRRNMRLRTSIVALDFDRGVAEVVRVCDRALLVNVVHPYRECFPIPSKLPVVIHSIRREEGVD